MSSPETLVDLQHTYMNDVRSYTHTYITGLYHQKRYKSIITLLPRVVLLAFDPRKKSLNWTRYNIYLGLLPPILLLLSFFFCVAQHTHILQVPEILNPPNSPLPPPLPIPRPPSPNTTYPTHLLPLQPT